MIDEDALAVFAPLLAEDEQLQWAAMVNRAAYARAARGHWFYAFVLVVTGVVLFIAGVALWALTTGKMSFLPSFALCGLGLASVAGAVHRVVVILRGARSAFALTDRRALAATAGVKRLRVWAPLSHVLGTSDGGSGDAGSVTLAAAPEDGRAAALALELHALRRTRDLQARLIDLIAPSLKPAE